MEEFVQARQEWPQTFLELLHGFARMTPLGEFLRAFLLWDLKPVLGTGCASVSRN